MKIDENEKKFWLGSDSGIIPYLRMNEGMPKGKVKQIEMLKKIVVIFCMTLVSAEAAYAASTEAETDEYGNVIDWDTEGWRYGDGEDSAGLETLEGVQETQKDYTFQEQQEVLQQIESAAAETVVSDTTGFLLVSLDPIPERWSEQNIELTLYSGSRKETVYLYRQDNWSARAELPEGEYTFYKASTPAGFEFHIAEGKGTFQITQQTPVTLVLEAGKAVPNVVIEENSEAAIGETHVEIESEDSVGAPRPAIACYVLAAVMAAVSVALVVGLIVWRVRKNKDRWR